MQYGFLIDHRRCIGCHACTVACKAENDVPLGSFRTWVKYVEKGTFPEVKRHFAVLRCNHCTNAPCVTICPVTALEKRHDGIVDIDRDVCIGCRACMQACPYDAIYLNADLGAVEKCHYCAHRVEKGLEPACVIVCPEQAIVSGDLHDPNSRIARMTVEHPTLRRRVEQNTGPNVHYVDALPLALQPGEIVQPPTFLWSEKPPGKREPWPATLPVVEDTRVTLDANHKVEWGAGVAAYLVTKGIAAGAALLAPFGAALGLRGFGERYVPELAALFFTLVTTFLLVEDLKRPRLFLTLLTRPNWKSWLVKGAWILIAFSMTVTLTLVASFLDQRTGLPPPLDLVAWGRLIAPLRWINAVLALGVAGYTAFLFAQCEGRDLWQSRRLFPHLILQAVLCGAALLLAFTPDTAQRVPFVVIAMLAAIGHLLFAFLERFGAHATANARQGAAFLGELRLFGIPAFRGGIFVIGALLLPLAFGPTVTLFLLPLVMWFGLYLYEWAFVRAGQLPPLS
jgi:Fe-S-cluster-containing dehydrogenase component/Ni/Fe-hydrogenase subunit HybB-like protein